MIIGFTGTQSGMTSFQKKELVKILLLKECSEFQHGDCIGADEEANELATIECGIKLITIHPPLHDVKRAYCFDPKKLMRQASSNWIQIGDLRVRWREPLPYLKRNNQIVDEVALMIACPKEDKHTVRSGTWQAIRHAWNIRRDIIIIPPLER